MLVDLKSVISFNGQFQFHCYNHEALYMIRLSSLVFVSVEASVSWIKVGKYTEMSSLCFQPLTESRLSRVQAILKSKASPLVPTRCFWQNRYNTCCMLQMLNIYEHFQSVDPGCTGSTFLQPLALLDIFSIWPVKWLKCWKSLLQSKSIFHCWFTAQSVVVGLIFTEWIREKVIVNSSAERGKQTANWLEIFSGAEWLQLAWISCGTSASMETKKD